MPYYKPPPSSPGSRAIVRARCPRCGMLTVLADALGEPLPAAVQPDCWGCRRGQARPLGRLERPYFRPQFADRKELSHPNRKRTA